MGHRRRAVLFVTGLVLSAAVPLAGIYIGVESKRVPVARLVGNLEKQLTTSPKDAELHIKLARLYGMAYAVNAEEVPVAIGRSGKEEVWFGHETNLVPHPVQPTPNATRTESSRIYLEKALEHYRAAFAISPENLVSHLGLAWALDQSGRKGEAVVAYREVIQKAWPKEQAAKFGELGQRFFTAEAAEYLVPLLNAKSDAEEIAELRRRTAHLQRLPRPITPIVIPLRPEATIKTIVDLDAQVRFDADGAGLQRRWTWITPDAGWLVYDADGKGQISSALQWFGNVSFWLFWRNGYEPLRALDDDGDGELTGRELRYLAIWLDRDRDGVSDPGEVRALGEHRIVAISCRFVSDDGLLATARSQAGVRFEDGSVRPTYDVIVRPAWSVSSPAPE